MQKTLFIVLALGLFFTIKAQEFELKSINFDGNDNFSDSQLKGTIYSEETPWWFYKFLNSFTSFGAGPIYFDSSDIQIDLEALKAFYNANGFFEASFKYSYDLDTSNNTAELNYKITEGPESKYGYTHIYGMEDVPSTVSGDIVNELKFDSTARYAQPEGEAKISSSINILNNSGYMTAAWDSTIIIKDTVEDRADMDMYFNPGKRYRIDTVLVELKGEGADDVSKDMLKDLVDIDEGSIYNLETIKERQARLFRTGLFNSLSLNASIKDTNNRRVPLKLEGTIGYMNELSPEIIVNNQQNALNVGLGALYTRKNFFGHARKLTVRSSFGVQDIFNIDYANLFKNFSFRDTTLLGYVELRATVEQPFIFQKPIYGIWDNYATIKKQSTYNNTIYGSKITFEFELPKYTFVNMLSLYYNVEQTNEVYRTNNDSLSRKLLSVLGAQLGKTTTDDILFPTKGFVISLQVEEANSLPYLITRILKQGYDGSLFYKLVFNNSFYLGLNDKASSVVAVKFKAGYIQVYHGDYSGIPINRTFYAGGSNSVRGWRTNELPGQDVKGGGALVDGSFELRNKFTDLLGAALFFDYGNSWQDFKAFRFNNLALAVGLGVRIYTPVAPFRLDFGFKLYDPADKNYLWQKQGVFRSMEFHFGIGEAF